MTKQEFEQKVAKMPIDSEVFFNFPDGTGIQIVNCHREEPDTLVLMTSPLGLQVDFRYLGHMIVDSAYYHASGETELIVRYNGKNYVPTEVLADNKIIIIK